MRTSIVIPAYNEEEAIEDVVNEVKAVRLPDKEIVVVDDGSSDGTYTIASRMKGIRLLRHAKNKGKAGALETGFDNSSGQVLATIDADCTYPAKEIAVMSRLIADGKADVVIGSRFMGRETGMSKLNYLGNVFFSGLISMLTGKRVTDASSGLRALRKEVWDSIEVKSKGLDWEVEFTTRVLRKGYRLVEIPIEYNERVGQAKLSPLRDGLRFLRAILRASFF
ncbi:MAG: glycosyltransferase family 2 protein [Candidatus Aenigmarchaeota archaeon]|nr:glycosyltransferase family 2 protein [Candidatus Aenigmarchaeota archaeon]